MPTLLSESLRGTADVGVWCGVKPERGDAGGDEPLSTKPFFLSVDAIVLQAPYLPHLAG